MNNKIESCIEDFIKDTKLPQYNGVIDKDIVDWAVRMAYGDAKRTMEGISKYASQRKTALADIAGGITDYFLNKEAADSQEEFDQMHEALCSIWTKAFEGIFIGTYGRAQKIVNMSFKYLYCVDYHKKNYYDWFRFAHITLDSYILDWMHQNKYVCSEIKFSKILKWSNLEQKMYNILEAKAARGIANTHAFDNYTALEAEFLIWDAAIVYRATSEYQKMLKKYKRRRYMNVRKAMRAGNIDEYIEKM